MPLDNPLWHYALKLYAKPGVEQAALELQNAGCSINRLLLACFLARRGERLTPDMLSGEALEWQRELTHPLRVLRYRVRNRKSERPELDAFYRRLREAELAAEQVELSLLWESIESDERPAAPAGESLARTNLQVVLADAGPTLVPRFSAQLEVLVHAAFGSDLASD
ncbi:TIGR02444 family protein [Marinobacterium litorale]|uniref:TIGR02444 family protein n=1 Tax=Marinobacterium litorale TaxID=404770 RepID=UPI00041179B1|nr:TIGR02444 family protein [Marinobacterium litorale]